ncbi:DUF4082 domain-containing protein [Gaetbulibacter sp. M235]|uniref:hypothetical protein n=1 Tax=Gaetbulibacter sp. M235 TaxID=3126510 RepID=UPI00374E4B65
MKHFTLTPVKTISKTALFFALTIILINCSKDDNNPTPNPEVNPLTEYLTGTGFNQVTDEIVDSGDYEFGITFIPAVNGKITAITAKIPDTHIATRVTIWNKTTTTVLRTESIDIASAGVEATKAISTLSLTAGTEYMITFNSNDWYNRERTDGADITYPVTVGDISITGYAYAGGTAQVLPTAFNLDYYAGDLSFKFQKD